MSTISASKLLSVANENFVASYRKLVEHSPEGEVNQVGGVFAFVTGFPFALFNGCVVVERAAPPALEEALAWVTAHGVPHRVWLAVQAAQKLEAVPLPAGSVATLRRFRAWSCIPCPSRRRRRSA